MVTAGSSWDSFPAVRRQENRFQGAQLENDETLWMARSCLAGLNAQRKTVLRKQHPVVILRNCMHGTWAFLPDAHRHHFQRGVISVVHMMLAGGGFHIGDGSKSALCCCRVCSCDPARNQNIWKRTREIIQCGCAGGRACGGGGGRGGGDSYIDTEIQAWIERPQSNAVETRDEGQMALHAGTLVRR